MNQNQAYSCLYPRIKHTHPQIVRLLLNSKYVAEAKPCVSTTLHYTIIVCRNRIAHSQYCLPARVEARELNLKYARATGELNPGPFAPATESVTTRIQRLC